MNPRVHLCLLRPVRSLIGIASIACVAFGAGHALFRLDWPTSRLLGLAVTLPLVIGFYLGGAAHEPMHRPFILLLPDGPRRLRNATALAVLFFAAVVTGLAAWAAPRVPLSAVFGLAAGLIAFPCADRRHRARGFAWLLAAPLAWGLFCALAALLLRPAMISAPAAFCFGGLALAAASLLYGFSRQNLRARAELPFRPLQSLLIPVRTDAAQLERESSCQRAHSVLGRDWNVKKVAPTTLAWMAVDRHAESGAYPRWSRSPMLLLWAAIMAVYFGLPLLGFLFDGKAFAADYGACLAQLAANRVDLSQVPSASRLAGLMTSMSSGMPPLFALIVALSFPIPKLTYPISRDRQARVVYGLMLLQLAIALFVPASALFLASLVGQIISNRFLPALGLPGVSALMVPLLVLLPLILSIVPFARSYWRLIGYIISIVLFNYLNDLRWLWIPFALTPLGVAGILILAAAGLELLRRRLLRHYLSCDLLGSSGLGNFMGFAMN
ncbi:MAG: hypothetical protein ABSF76_03835 [Opitutaceae bacterium]